jgi:signal transduction histidine kinase
MIFAALPADEELRLQDLYSYKLLDSVKEVDFDELAELASQLFNTPIASITFVDRDREWYKTSLDISQTQTGRQESFGSYVILEEGIFMVEDTAADERFPANPLVTEAGVRFYAGAPVVSPDGYKIGTICIMDDKPRTLSDAEKKALVILSKQVTNLIQLRKNHMILTKTAAEIIDLKTKNIGRVLQGREDDKMHIATTLHEDIAQRIASDILLIDIATKNEDRSFAIAEKIKTDLKGILADIRTLTYSIIPYSLHLIPADELVAEFAEKISSKYNFDVNIIIHKNNNRGTPENALSAIRILEQWFNFLYDKKTIIAFNLTIETNTHFQMLLEYNSTEAEFNDLQHTLQDSMIFDRVYALDGSIEYTFSNGYNLLTISLPVLKK